MFAVQATVTSMQVAAKYQRNVSSLLIDMSADDRTTTLSQHVDLFLWFVREKTIK